MHRLLTLVLATLLLAPALRAEPKAELPASARQALERLEGTIVQAKKRAVSELTAAMNSETRAGRTEAAMAIGEKIQELNADVAALLQKPEGKRGQPVLAGTWRMHNGVLFALDKNNTFAASGGNFKWSGKWTVSDGKLVVDSAQFVDTYDLPPQREKRNGKAVWSLKGRNSKGEPIFMERED